MRIQRSSPGSRCVRTSRIAFCTCITNSFLLPLLVCVEPDRTAVGAHLMTRLCNRAWTTVAIAPQAESCVPLVLRLFTLDACYQRVKQGIEFMMAYQFPPPFQRNCFHTEAYAGECASDRAGCVGIVTEVYGGKDGRFETMRVQKTPQARLQSIDDIARRAYPVAFHSSEYGGRPDERIGLEFCKEWV